MNACPCVRVSSCESDATGMTHARDVISLTGQAVSRRTHLSLRQLLSVASTLRFFGARVASGTAMTIASGSRVLIRISSLLIVLRIDGVLSSSARCRRCVTLWSWHCLQMLASSAWAESRKVDSSHCSLSDALWASKRPMRCTGFVVVVSVGSILSRCPSLALVASQRLPAFPVYSTPVGSQNSPNPTSL